MQECVAAKPNDMAVHYFGGRKNKLTAHPIPLDARRAVRLAYALLDKI